MQIDKVKGHMAMIVANMSWGLMSPFVKTVVLNSNINAWTIVAFRVIGAALAFWTASIFIPKEKVPKRDLLLLVVAALFGIILNQGVFVLGVSYTSPISASIVTTTLPMIAMVISAFYLKEPITWKKVLGILIGGSGALIIILSSSMTNNSSSGLGLKGILLCFAAQFSYAIYFVFFKKLISRYTPITLMKWMFLFSTIIYLPLTWGQLSTIEYTELPNSIIGQIAFIVLGSTFLSYMMIPIAQKYLRPTVATMYNNVQPIIASIAAIVLQIDVFKWTKVAAIALVFCGVYLVTTSRSKNENTASESH